jgi:hypothetical protein
MLVIQSPAAALAEGDVRCGMLCCMARRRRGATDSLNSVNEPRWRVVRDACSRAIEFEALAA